MRQWKQIAFFALFFVGSLIALRFWRSTHSESDVAGKVSDIDSTGLFAEEDNVGTTEVVLNGSNDKFYQRNSLYFDQLADTILRLLADSNYTAIAAYIDPDLGLRFSPYAYVDTAFRPVSRSFLLKPPAGKKIFWGYYDGSGEEIRLTLPAYHRRFVYNADFIHKGLKGINEPLVQGNSLDNLEQIFKGCSYVSYYVEGTEKYGGMDWKVLRLVFKQKDGHWFLIGIVHDQWTI